MTQEQLRQQSGQTERLNGTIDLDGILETLYKRLEETVDAMDPVRVDDILTNVLICEKPEKADIYAENGLGLNLGRRQLYDSFYNDYIDWKWSMFLSRQRNPIFLRKKDVIQAIGEMDKAGGNSATFNRFVWVALGREVIKAVGSDKRITQAEEANKRGVELVRTGDYEEALSRFDEAIQFNRRFCMPFVNKGIALRNLGRIREAVDCFQLAVATDSNFKLAWFNMALVFKKTGDFNYAQEAIRRALAIDPEYEAAKVLKEETLLKSKVSDGRRN